jgi:hypothetical protein
MPEIPHSSARRVAGSLVVNLRKRLLGVARSRWHNNIIGLREIGWELREVGGNCIMRSFITCTLRQV